jgi:hypothetical protein
MLDCLEHLDETFWFKELASAQQTYFFKKKENDIDLAELHQGFRKDVRLTTFLVPNAFRT